MLSRRRLLHTIITSGSAPLILPRHLIAGSGQTPPSEQLATAHIGVSGQGGGNLGEIGKFPEVKVVALCDVDESRLAGPAKEYPGARTHRDWRKLFDSQKDFDAVVVSTPDHHHAPIALTAMLLGKHVYVEKPLAHTVEEARLMFATADKMKVVTQMGNNGHGGDGLRRWKEYIDAGTIGTPTEIHVWSDRPGGWWGSQGKPRPTDTPAVPASLDWDLWLGPAPLRPYHPSYHPMQWRGIKDFGCGALGDMAVHNADPAYFALDLGAPDWVDAETSPPNADSFPAWTIVTWHFPAKGNRPAITMKWYDGGKRPANVPFVDPALNLGDNGLIIAGSKAALFGGSHASPPRLLPSEAQASTPVPPKTLARSPGHRIEWVRAAIAGNPKDAMSGFWYSAPFTESLLTGMLAVEFQKRLTWDAAALRSPDTPDADRVVRKLYRDGWKLPV